MKIRTAAPADMPEIINVINTTFAQVRDYEFDIRDIQPKVYKSHKDYSAIHTVIEENSQIVSLAGSYKNVVHTANNSYPFSILGSVSTLPQYQGKGYFKKLVTKVLEDNKSNGDVFTMLTGLRHRYNYFGFEKCGFRYYFDIDINFCKYQKSKEGLVLLPFTEDMLDQIYDIYQKRNEVIPRQKEEFINILQTSNSSIFVYKLNNKIIGYTTFNFIKNRINEFIVDKRYIPYCVKLIFDYFNQKHITIVVSPFDKDTIYALDKFAEDKKTTEQIHFKIYDMVKFLQMMFEINQRVKVFPDYNQVFKIDEQNIEINIINNRVTIASTTKIANENFSSKDFLRYAFGLNSLYQNSKIFPLFLDFNYADLF